MVNLENTTRGETQASSSPLEQRDRAVPSREAALQSSPEERRDWQLGRGVMFHFGTNRTLRLERYTQVMRLRFPRGDLALHCREPQVALEGVILSVFLSHGRATSPRGLSVLVPRSYCRNLARSSPRHRAQRRGNTG